MRFVGMTKLRYLAVFMLAGCPPPPRYLVAEIRTAAQPVENAMVAVDCASPHGYALRTDDAGRARIRVQSSVDPGKCTVTAAKPGFRTVQASGAQICDTPRACPPITLQLYPLGPFGAGPLEPGGPPPPPSASSPPAEVAE
jgi:hypothetical protein